MHSTKETFIEYGGHAYSGGFSVSEAAVHTLEDALVAAHATVAAGAQGDAQKYADATLTLRDVSWDTYRMLAQLGPFGEGNPKPVFIIREVMPVQVRRFGKGNEHLEVTFANETGVQKKAIAFFTSPESYPVLQTGGSCTLAAHLEASFFRNTRDVRLRLLAVW